MSLWFEILLALCIILITLKIMFWTPTTVLHIWHKGEIETTAKLK